MVLHKFINTETNEEIPIKVIQSYELPSSSSIIVNESATGNSGTSYNNGRTQESIPVNGVLYADTTQQLNAKITKLYLLLERGTVIEYIKPIKNNSRTNKYYLQEFSPSASAKNLSVAFTATLTEYRESNVKKVKVILVGLESVERMREMYYADIGNNEK